MSVSVYLGLGSNQGNRAEILSKAIKELEAFGQVIAQSSFIETEPFGFVSLNAVICLETDLSALSLLKETQAIEKAFGRQQKSKDGIYSDRPLDIDILFYGSELIKESNLIVPHKELHKRLFVLEPLREIAANLIHPLLNKSIEELYKELNLR